MGPPHGSSTELAGNTRTCADRLRELGEFDRCHTTPTCCCSCMEPVEFIFSKYQRAVMYCDKKAKKNFDLLDPYGGRVYEFILIFMYCFLLQPFLGNSHTSWPMHFVGIKNLMHR